MRLILHLADEGHIVCHARHLIEDELLSLFVLLIRYAVCDTLVITDGQEHFIQVVFNQTTGKALVGDQFLREMPDRHFVFRIVAEDPNIHFQPASSLATAGLY